MRLSQEDAAAVMVLIESLNDDGYLADPLEEIAAQLLGPDSDDEEREALVDRLRCAPALPAEHGARPAWAHATWPNA